MKDPLSLAYSKPLMCMSACNHRHSLGEKGIFDKVGNRKILVAMGRAIKTVKPELGEMSTPLFSPYG